MNKYIKNGKELPYVIKVKNNKHTYFRFKEDYLEISKSKYLTDHEVIKLVDNKFDYFYEKLKKVNRLILDDYQIMLENNIYKIMLTTSVNKAYYIEDDKIYISHSSNNTEEIKKWIYKEHLNVMISRIELEINNILWANKIKPRKIRTKYFKSKYGSYHRKKDEVSLNIILAKLDIQYLYYVLMHEYAHTIVFNHSKDFYMLLAKLMPNYKLYDKKLKAMAIYI